MENKIFFYRDLSQESAEAEKMLRENHVEFVEVFTKRDDKLPEILSTERNCSYKGLDGIRFFITQSRAFLVLQ